MSEERKRAWTPGPWRISGKATINAETGGWVASLSQWNRRGNAHLIAAAPELAEVVQSFIDETIDYMTRNNLGDPEKQHNVKWGRAILAKARGEQS